jgi:hypothetical protein
MDWCLYSLVSSAYSLPEKETALDLIPRRPAAQRKKEKKGGLSSLGETGPRAECLCPICA